jgi:hypothetical protein
VNRLFLVGVLREITDVEESILVEIDARLIVETPQILAMTRSMQHVVGRNCAPHHSHAEFIDRCTRARHTTGSRRYRGQVTNVESIGSASPTQGETSTDIYAPMDMSRTAATMSRTQASDIREGRRPGAKEDLGPKKTWGQKGGRIARDFRWMRTTVGDVLQESETARHNACVRSDSSSETKTIEQKGPLTGAFAFRPRRF